jgi:hypothetical protein
VKALHVDTGNFGNEAVRRRHIAGLVGESQHRLLVELSGNHFGDSGQFSLTDAGEMELTRRLECQPLQIF